MNTLHGKPTDRAPVFAVLGAYGGNSRIRTCRLATRMRKPTSPDNVRRRRPLPTWCSRPSISAPLRRPSAPKSHGCRSGAQRRSPAVCSAGAAIRPPSPDPRRSGKTTRRPGSYRSDLRKCTAGACLCSLVPPGRAPCLHSYSEWKAGWKPYCSTKRPPGCFWTTRASFTWPGPGPAGIRRYRSRLERTAAAEISSRQLVRRQASPSPEGHVRVRAGPMIIHHTGGRINHILDSSCGL